MAHEMYGPVGYIYQGDQYCLDCIPSVVAWNYRTTYIQADGCNCAECVLDRIADDRGINPYDERSFDSGDFPKAISYFNDIHAECGPEGYGYGPDDPEWREQYCNATCGKCHAVIDGTVLFDGEGHWEVKCPVWLNRKEEGFKS